MHVERLERSPSSRSAAIVRAACLLLDITIILVGLVVLGVIVSGGGVFEWRGTVIRMRTVANPLSIVFALVLLRVSTIRSVPVLLRFPGDDLEHRALHGAQRLSAALSDLPHAQAARWTMIAIVVATLVKAANAWFYPGFFSGDDVEIHEMTFRQLFRTDWEVWTLRSPFYPMTFIYPVQALLVSLGLTDTGPLIVAGRCAVVLVSSLGIWLTYRAGSLLEGPALGLIAAGTLALHRLHMTFGGSELPRPVSSAFVMVGYLLTCAGRGSWLMPVAAGAAFGIAACSRFSEFIFLLPALAVLAIEGRFRDAILVSASTVCTTLAILGVGDALFWGTPFFSLANIVQYTLVDRLSSRGYEPLYYYVTALHQWTALPIAILALVGVRFGSWKVGLWWMAPIALLSLLPHKEPRYLIPILPFVAMSAAQGLMHLLARLRSGDAMLSLRPELTAVLLAVACAYAGLLEVGGWRFRKSGDGIVVALSIAQAGCDGTVAVEQQWRLGGRLYLRQCARVRDLDPSAARAPDRLRSMIDSDVEWLVLDRETAPAVEAAVVDLGFDRQSVTDQQSYVVFRRRVEPNTRQPSTVRDPNRPGRGTRF